VISLKRTVGGRGPNLQHQMSASSWPAHVLLCVHSPVQQPLHGASVIAIEIGSSWRRAVA
jgi:hypothetical protein